MVPVAICANRGFAYDSSVGAVFSQPFIEETLILVACRMILLLVALRTVRLNLFAAKHHVRQHDVQFVAGVINRWTMTIDTGNTCFTVFSAEGLRVEVLVTHTARGIVGGLGCLGLVGRIRW